MEASESYVEQAVELHEADHPHHDGAECAARIAILEARIAELEANQHAHIEEEFEEVPAEELEEV